MMRRISSAAELGRKKALSSKLRSLMDERGLSLTDLAKRMSDELPGERFNPVNLSHYKAGRSMPRPRYLKALSRVLGVAPEDLIAAPPVEAVVRQDEDQRGHFYPAFKIETLSDGQVWLQINQRLPWPLALRVLETLKGSKDGIK